MPTATATAAAPPALRIGAWVDRRGVGSDWRRWLDVAFDVGLTDVSLVVHAQDAGRAFDPFADPEKVGAICRAYAAAGIRPHIMLWPQPRAAHATALLAYVDEVHRCAAGTLASAELDAEEQWTRSVWRLAAGAKVAAQLRAGWPAGLPLVVNGITAAIPRIKPLLAIADTVIPQAYTADRPNQRSVPGERQTVVLAAWREAAPHARLACGLAAYNQDGLHGLPAREAMGRAFAAAVAAGVTEVRYWSLADLAGGPDADFVRARCQERRRCAVAG